MVPQNARSEEVRKPAGRKTCFSHRQRASRTSGIHHMSSIDMMVTLLGYKLNRKLGDFRTRYRKDRRRPANTGANPWSQYKIAGLSTWPKILSARLQAVHTQKTGLLEVSSGPTKTTVAKIAAILPLFTLFNRNIDS
ncbi:unnamed protein product [Ixodes persulcatus]